MELDELLKLIQAVSDSELTGFKYEAEGVCLNLKKEKEGEDAGNHRICWNWQLY